MTRAFVAVRPPDDVLDAVGTAFAALDFGSDARRTTREQWHVTLQFLGNDADVSAVVDVLGALDVRAGVVQLGGLGAFPNANRARVVWLGVSAGAELFAALAGEVGRLLRPLGHEPEDRAFHPHLTAARLKVPSDMRAVVGTEAVGRAWPASEVVVYESRLRPAGAEYVARATIPLVDP